LTPRQREVLTLIAGGHCTKNIAHSLNISVKTVESHRSQLMDRLNIHEVASLVRYAIKMCLVSLDAPLVRKMGDRINLILTLSTLLFSWLELQMCFPFEIT